MLFRAIHSRSRRSRLRRHVRRAAECQKLASLLRALSDVVDDSGPVQHRTRACRTCPCVAHLASRAGPETARGKSSPGPPNASVPESGTEALGGVRGNRPFLDIGPDTVPGTPRVRTRVPGVRRGHRRSWTTCQDLVRRELSARGSVAAGKVLRGPLRDAEWFRSGSAFFELHYSTKYLLIVRHT